MAGAIAAAAAFSMIATPALARGGSWGGWGKRYHHRHHDGIDTGDVLAGILILGGIAAVASAASKSARDGRERDYPQPDYPQPERRDAPSYGEPRERAETGPGSIGMAVDVCADEVERADRSIDAITSVERDGEGWRVEGRVSNGHPFACSVADSGRIRSVTVDGRAAWSDDRGGDDDG